MTGAEKIVEAEFREIVGIPLDTSLDVYRVLEVFTQLRSQYKRLIFTTLGVIFICGTLSLLVIFLRMDLKLLVIPGVGLLLLLLIGMRYVRLKREMDQTQTVLRAGKLQQTFPNTVKFVSELGHWVMHYNTLVAELNESQSGLSWREFRKLTEDQRTHIQSCFVRTRMQLIAALRACRQMIDYPEIKAMDLIPKQIIFREQELKYEFAAKTMTSEYYLQITAALKTLEREVQERIQTLGS